MFTKDLKTIGLNNGEAAIYSFLLCNGDASATEIAKSKGIGRTNVYEYAGLLKAKGLISEYERKRKTYFHAESPAELAAFVQRKVSSIRQVEATLEDIFPRLLQCYEEGADMPSLKNYLGDAGFREVQNLIYLQGGGEELYLYVRDLDSYEPPEPRYRNAIHNRGLRTTLLAARGNSLQEFQKRDERENRLTRIYDLKMDGDLALIEDRIVFGNFSRDGFKVSVLRSFLLAGILRNLFRQVIQ